MPKYRVTIDLVLNEETSQLDWLAEAVYECLEDGEDMTSLNFVELDEQGE